MAKTTECMDKRPYYYPDEDMQEIARRIVKDGLMLCDACRGFPRCLGLISAAFRSSRYYTEEVREALKTNLSKRLDEKKKQRKIDLSLPWASCGNLHLTSLEELITRGIIKRDND